MGLVVFFGALRTEFREINALIDSLDFIICYNNMKKLSYFFGALSVFLAVALLFSSCSSTPVTDEIEETENYSDNTGTCIEVSLSGDYEHFKPSVQFEALEASGNAVLLEGDDGKSAHGFLYKHYEDEPFNVTSAVAKGNYRFFSAAVFFLNVHGIDGKITVAGRIYRKGKLYKSYTQTVTISKTNTGAAVLLNEDGFQSVQYM